MIFLHRFAIWFVFLSIYENICHASGFVYNFRLLTHKLCFYADLICRKKKRKDSSYYVFFYINHNTLSFFILRILREEVKCFFYYLLNDYLFLNVWRRRWCRWWWSDDFIFFWFLFANSYACQTHFVRFNFLLQYVFFYIWAAKVLKGCLVSCYKCFVMQWLGLGLGLEKSKGELIDYNKMGVKC